MDWARFGDPNGRVAVPEPSQTMGNALGVLQLVTFVTSNQYLILICSVIRFNLPLRISKKSLKTMKFW